MGVKANECIPAEAMMQETARLNGRHKALDGKLGSPRAESSKTATSCRGANGFMTGRMLHYAVWIGKVQAPILVA